MTKFINGFKDKSLYTQILLCVIVLFALFATLWPITQIAFIIVLSLLFVFVCVVLDIEKCFCILMFLFNFRAIGGNLYQVSLYNIFMIIFAISFSIKYFIRMLQQKDKPYIIPCIISCLLVAYSFINFNIANFVDILFLGVILVIFYLAFVNSENINVYKIIKYFLNGVLLSALIGYILIAIPQTKFIAMYIPEQRFKALVEHPNHLQIMCLIALSLLVWVYFKGKIKYLPFLVCCFLLTVVGLSTKSKAFLIIFAILLLILLIILLKKDKKKGLLTLTGVLTFGVLGVAIFHKQFIALIDRFTQYEYSNFMDIMLTGRWSIWQSYLEEWSSSFISIIFGCGVTAQGVGNFGPHNIFILLLYKFGIVGLLLIVGLLITYFNFVKNKKTRFKIINLVPLIIFILSACTESIWGATLLFFELIALTLFDRDKISSKQCNNYSLSSIEKDKISVILPIYNVESYLRRGLDSVINQTYTNLEIILIDDGSKDKSAEICDEYALKDNRIKVIHKANGGVSSARNEGLKAATGDYITFMDPDDILDANMYLELYNAIETNNSDLAMCGYKHIFEKDELEKIVIENNLAKIETESIYPYLLKIGSTEKDGNIYTDNIMGCVWRVLFKKEILKGITFADLKLSEDLVFIIDVFDKNPKVAIVDKNLYGYVQRISSAMHSFNENKIEQKLKSFKTVLEKTEGKVSIEQHSAYKYHIYASIINELLKNNQFGLIEKYINSDFMKSLNSEENYKLAQKNAKGLSHKIAYFMIRHKKLKLYSFLLKFI